MRRRSKSRAERLEQVYRRLGTRDPVCIGCGETYPFCFELHHLAGRKHHGDTVIVCRNCHCKLTDQQLDHVSLPAFEPQSQMVVMGCYLLGLCDLLDLVTDTLRAFAHELIERERAVKK